MRNLNRLFVCGRGFNSAVLAARDWRETCYKETGYNPQVFILVDALDASSIIREDGRVEVDENVFNGEEQFMLMSEAFT
jgi:hypothetical protein